MEFLTGLWLLVGLLLGIFLFVGAILLWRGASYCAGLADNIARDMHQRRREAWD